MLRQGAEMLSDPRDKNVWKSDQSVN
jgi:hypothetical protein